LPIIMAKQIESASRFLPRAVLFMAVLTLGNSVANVVMPFKLPTAHELQRARQAERTDARKAHLASLLAAGDHLPPGGSADEIAERARVRRPPATTYAADYTHAVATIRSCRSGAGLSPKLFAALAPAREVMICHSVNVVWNSATL